MTILVDTNVILDILLKREPYIDAARIIMSKCAEREIDGYFCKADRKESLNTQQKAAGEISRRF